MSVWHHPSDATLMAYANGNLAEGAALAVALHLGACPDCSQTVRIAETIGGVLLDELPPVAMTTDAFAGTLARLEAEPAREPLARPSSPQPEQAWLPEPLRQYPLGPWRWLGPGIRQIVVVPLHRGASARLLRLVPGRALPRHGHDDVELSCVLRGSLNDEHGSFGPYDISEMDPWERHRPVAGAEEPCICLVATTGHIRLWGAFGELIQTVLRI